ncbi:hypothetical protein P0R31_35200 [Bradyrhizobium yuanmingense]|uniref:hypothetical protein n=1 Tax=Bradyrhizobium yuanmingense TaxID=108015 RepID=UPI0023BA265F|nr:hypothetical protein [Bradyrhizobium yuanmingense]MDF0522489.1 hypothetical protein [Bradyrhizobium yuanmingense]
MHQLVRRRPEDLHAGRAHCIGERIQTTEAAIAGDVGSPSELVQHGVVAVLQQRRIRQEFFECRPAQARMVFFAERGHQPFDSFRRSSHAGIAAALVVDAEAELFVSDQCAIARDDVVSDQFWQTADVILMTVCHHQQIEMVGPLTA